jgi:hypothetical protein
MPGIPIYAWKDLTDVDGRMQVVGVIQRSLFRDGLEINPAKVDAGVP